MGHKATVRREARQKNKEKPEKRASWAKICIFANEKTTQLGYDDICIEQFMELSEGTIPNAERT